MDIWDHQGNYQKIHTQLLSESSEDLQARKQSKRPRKRMESEEAVLQKFASLVEIQGECWNWIGSLNGAGYGRLKFRGKMMRAHRVSYLLFRGEIPGRLLACHYCDNPKCVNPCHIFLGNHNDNNQDKIAKGRQPEGERHWCKRLPTKIAKGEKISRKLTEGQVLSIRSEYRRGQYGFGCKSLAKKYGVNPEAIARIISRKTWSHLNPSG